VGRTTCLTAPEGIIEWPRWRQKKNLEKTSHLRHEAAKGPRWRQAGFLFYLSFLIFNFLLPAPGGSEGAKVAPGCL
jgi:hypothetical protein